MKTKTSLFAIVCFAIAMTSTKPSFSQQWLTAGNSLTADAILGATSGNYHIKFYSNGSERMRLTNSGNVGVGITGPYSKLHAHSSANLSLTSAGIFTLGSVTGTHMLFDSDDIQGRLNGAGAKLKVNYYGGDIHLGNDATVGSTTPVLYVKSSGVDANVGIGTSSPSHKLHVNNGNQTTSGFFYNNYSGSSDKFGVYSDVTSKGTGTNYGVYSKCISNTADASDAIGIYSFAADSGNGNSYGVYGYAYGGHVAGTSTKYAIGVYGKAEDWGGPWVSSWGGYFPTKVFATELRVGGETGADGYKLSVDGKVICEELRVMDSGSWPDYVFTENYRLLTLEEVEDHIKNKKHLPGIPSSSDIEENGINVGQMQKMMMEKIEELTLYIIELKKSNTELSNRMAQIEFK